MKLACVDIIAPGETWTEKADNLRKLGFQGMSVFPDRQTWNDEKKKELLHLYDNTGIHPCEFVFQDPVYGHLMDEDPLIRRKALDLYFESVEMCNLLGAITEMEYEYRVQDPPPLFQPYKKMQTYQLEELRSILKTLCDAAKGETLVLLELCNRYECKYLNSIEDCCEFLEPLEKSRTGLLIDFFQLSIEEKNTPASIRRCKDLVKHVHLGDSNRLLPGHGSINWAEGLKALRDIGFEGYMSLECAIIGDPYSQLKDFMRFFSLIMS